MSSSQALNPDQLIEDVLASIFSPAYEKNRYQNTFLLEILETLHANMENPFAEPEVLAAGLHLKLLEYDPEALLNALLDDEKGGLTLEELQYLADQWKLPLRKRNLPKVLQIGARVLNALYLNLSEDPDPRFVKPRKSLMNLQKES